MTAVILHGVSGLLRPSRHKEADIRDLEVALWLPCCTTPRSLHLYQLTTWYRHHRYIACSIKPSGPPLCTALSHRVVAHRFTANVMTGYGLFSVRSKTSPAKKKSRTLSGVRPDARHLRKDANVHATVTLPVALECALLG